MSTTIGVSTMPKEQVYEGGCLCGFIRFRAVGVASNPHTCSCRDCQHHSGSLTLPWVEFPKDSVRWTGEGGEPSRFRSSDFSSRTFCPQCGSTLGAIDDDPIVALVLGTFDSPNRQRLMPTSHSYVSRRPSWWHVDASKQK